MIPGGQLETSHMTFLPMETLLSLLHKFLAGFRNRGYTWQSQELSSKSRLLCFNEASELGEFD